MPPSVAIVIVNWNGWRDSVDCLESLDDLEFVSYSVIVVDNDSTDESVEVLHRRFPNLEIVRTPRNLGFGGGCNFGAEQGSAKDADFIWFLNNDAVADAGALNEMVRLALDDPAVGAVGSVVHEKDRTDVIQSWGGGRIRMLLGSERHFTRPVPSDRLDWINGASILVRSAAFDQIGGFDESFFMYWEDTDLAFRLRRAGWKLAIAGGSIVWHKGSATLGSSSPRSHSFFNQSAVQFFRRHARFPVVPIVVGVTGRVIKQLLRGRLACSRAALSGGLAGLRQRKQLRL